MVVFNGKSLGVPFREEANDPFDLCRKLLPEESNVKNDYRMWIELPTSAGGKFWFDVNLITSSTSSFDFAMGEFLSGASEVKALIRGANEHSPNTSPDGKPVEALTETPEKPTPTSPSSLPATVSNLTESASGLTIAPSGSYNTYNAVNLIEPFTQENISGASTGLIPLYFPSIRKGSLESVQVVLVDSEGLKRFVTHQCDNAKEAVDLSLHVRCRDGKQRQFRLSEFVWVGSILEHSAFFRNFFAEHEHVKVLREQQLKELKEKLPDLYAKVRYWIADMFHFEEGEDRLQTPMEAHDVPNFMSPYYFTEMEARYLGNFSVPGSMTLKSYLKGLVETEDNICTSHNLAPKLMRVFQIRKKFHEDKSFQIEFEEWRRAQELISKGKPTGLGE